MNRILSAAAVAGLLLAGACSRGEDTKDGVTAKERADLDNAAMMLEGNTFIDTSADSLVLDEGAADPAVPADNSSAPAANAAAPTSNAAAPANQAAPR